MSIILKKRKHFMNNSKNINHLSLLNLLISFLLLFIAVLTLFYNSNTAGFSTFGLSCWLSIAKSFGSYKWLYTCSNSRAACLGAYIARFFGLSYRTWKKSLKYPSSDFFICSYYLAFNDSFFFKGIPLVNCFAKFF